MIRLCALSLMLFSYIIVLVFLFVGLLTFRTLQCDWKALLAAWDVPGAWAVLALWFCHDCSPCIVFSLHWLRIHLSYPVISSLCFQIHFLFLVAVGWDGTIYNFQLFLFSPYCYLEIGNLYFLLIRILNTNLCS